MILDRRHGGVVAGPPICPECLQLIDDVDNSIAVTVITGCPRIENLGGIVELNQGDVDLITQSTLDD